MAQNAIGDIVPENSPGFIRRQMNKLASRTSRITAEASYQYMPLANPGFEIRLAILEPGEGRARIKVQIIHTDIRKSPPYEALSYTWGDPANTVSIRVDDARFEATTNLESALKHLRRRDSERMLWIDAICINQQDIVERNHQVRRMKQIYHSAIKVVAWLGPRQDNSDLAMRVLTGTMREQIIPSIDSRTDLEEFLRDANLSSEKVAQAYAALSCLLERSWWRRAWIIQEVCSRTPVSITCGTEEILWEEAWPLIHEGASKNHISFFIESLPSRRDRESARLWSDKVDQIIHVMQPATFLDTMRIGERYDGTFLKIIKTMRDFQASDARDKVWIALSLSNESYLANKVDYGLSIGQTFAFSVSCYITTRQNLNILEQCECRPNATTLPSWTPDWSRPMNISPIWKPHGFSNLPSPASDARKSSKPLSAAILDGRNLNNPMTQHSLYKPMDSGPQLQMVVNGYELDKITEIRDMRGNAAGDVFTFEDLSSLVTEALKWVDLEWTEPTSSSDPLIARLELIFKTLCGDELLPAYLSDIAGQWARKGNNSNSEPKGWADEGMEILFWKGFIPTFIRLRIHRKLLLSSKSVLGLAPSTVNVRDIIVVLQGGQKPFVLRPRADGTYSLIGTCFLMPGARFDKRYLKHLDVADTEFVLQ